MINIMIEKYIIIPISIIGLMIGFPFLAIVDAKKLRIKPVMSIRANSGIITIAVLAKLYSINFLMRSLTKARTVSITLTFSLFLVDGSLRAPCVFFCK